MTGRKAVLLMILLIGWQGGTGMLHAAEPQDTDRKAVIDHIKTIFEAYIRKDRDTIRRTHSEDWTGFQGPSTKIERGIEDYMVNADRSLETIDGTGYEILDTEVQFFGEVAIVYYVATYSFRAKDGKEGSLRLKSVDIYRKNNGDWIQCGSNITPIRTGGNWGEGQAPDE